MIVFGGGSLPAEAIAPEAFPEIFRPASRPPEHPRSAHSRPVAIRLHGAIARRGWGYAIIDPDQHSGRQRCRADEGRDRAGEQRQLRKPDD